MIPVLLIVLAARGATPTQKIGLVRDYLIGTTQRPARFTAADEHSPPATRGAPLHGGVFGRASSRSPPAHHPDP